jgi:hypothetical protein
MILAFIICIGLPIAFSIWLFMQIPKLQEAQADFCDEVRLSLEKRGFKIDKLVKIRLPSSRYYLNPNWVPAVYCFFFIDYKHKKWSISYNQKREPKIYEFKDFREINLDVNGSPAGNTGLNALIGALVGGVVGSGFGPTYHSFDGVFHNYTSPVGVAGAVLGASLAAALTRRYGLIKEMSLRIRMNNPNDQFMTLPVVTAPLRGLKDTDKGLEFVMDFIKDMNDAFLYISENS